MIILLKVMMDLIVFRFNVMNDIRYQKKQNVNLANLLQELKEMGVLVALISVLLGKSL